MKKLCLKILLALKLVLLSNMVFAETAVIINPANASTLDKSEIANIFLGKNKSFSNGVKAVPFGQKSGNAASEAFDKEILGKSSSQLKAYWSKLIFTGKGKPPKELANDAEVKSMVAGDPGGIGYIDSSAVDSSVKVVMTF